MAAALFYPLLNSTKIEIFIYFYIFIYLDAKKLRLNIDKTKIMRFREKGGRKRECIGRWKRVKIEEVKGFKYIGYIIQANGDQEAHLRDSIKKAFGIIKQI